MCYIVRPDDVPIDFSSPQEERMFQLPLTGSAFQLDNQQVYRELKAFLINSPRWAWIQPYDSTEDGRAAFKAWSAHYNGDGELIKQTAIAQMPVSDSLQE